ncbi:MAG: hypothetical protein ABEH65_07120 [Halobacteriales archaeon]
MTVSAGSVVEHHLRQLDQATLAAFVAELWSARGYETRIEDEEPLVIATKVGRSTVLYPVVTGRFDTATPSLPDRSIDGVVAPRTDRQVPRIVERTNAELFDAAAIREMLWYAVDRPTRRTLCTRYLGGPPENLQPSVRIRVRERARALGSSAAVVSIISLVLLGAIIGGIADVGQPPTADSSPETPPGTEAPITGTDSTPTETSDQSSSLWNVPVPGVTEDGITNLSALATAHEQSLANRSYTLWLDVYRPRDGRMNASRVQRDIDIAVEDGQYRLDLSIEEVESGSRRSVRTVYYDGSAWYTANTTGDNVTYSHTDSFVSSPALEYNPFVLERSLVLKYLSTPRTETAGRVVDGDRTYYRIVGHGPPSGFSQVWGYTAVATVTRDGFVISLRIEYTKIADTGTYEVRFTATYDRLDDTTVDAPAWYTQRYANTTNGTSGLDSSIERPASDQVRS